MHQSGSECRRAGARARQNYSCRKLVKPDVQAYLFEHAQRSVAGMKRVGKFVEGEYRKQGLQEMHRGLSASDILVTVGGGDAGGHSAFIPSWSRSRGSIMQHQSIGVCVDC